MGGIWRHRLVTAVAGLGMVAGLAVPASAAPVAAAAPAGSVQVADRFIDVSSTNQFRNEIHWLADQGITTGWPDGTFRPLNPVNRDAMAAFLYRYAGKPAWTPPATSPFVDVPTTSMYYREITWLADQGITTGWPDGTFRPLNPINRDAMAAFLYRYAGKPTWTPPAASPFVDVPTGSQYYREITWLAGQGITTGWPDGTFRPLNRVARDATAAFLYRFAQLPDTTPPSPVTGVRVTDAQPNSLTLAWTVPSSADVAQVIVRRVTGSVSPASATSGVNVPLASAKATSVADAGLAADTEYSYAVFTRDAAGNTSTGTGITVRTADVSAPGQVAHLAAIDADADSVTLSWTNPTDTDLDSVIVRRAAGGTPPTSATAGIGVPLTSSKTTSVTDSGLVADTEYSYAVFAQDRTGNTSPGAGISARTAKAWIAITAGGNHTCGLDSDGSAWCWGDREAGALGHQGDGHYLNTYAPIRVLGGHTFTQIAAGDARTCALDTAGAAWCWGGYTWGATPTKVPGGRTFQHISVGKSHACGLDLAGAAWCWGHNGSAQLGWNGTRGWQSDPVPVHGGHVFTQVVAGGVHTCALDLDGFAWCWGNGNYSPSVVDSQRSYLDITAGQLHSCGIDANGGAWCWGSDSHGQLGDGSSIADQSAPVRVAGGRTYSAIKASPVGTCALDSKGNTLCWGIDSSGQVGDGSASQADKPVPALVAGSQSFTEFEGGWLHTCAIDAQGNAWCWGADNYGQLGNGYDANNGYAAYEPVRVAARLN